MWLVENKYTVLIIEIIKSGLTLLNNNKNYVFIFEKKTTIIFLISITTPWLLL